MFDLALAVAIPISLVLVPFAYAMRRLRWGEVHFERVDRLGGSALIGKRWLEMGYWALQPAARACVRHHISANALTASSLALGLAAGITLGLGHFGAAAVLLVMASACDAFDGIVARETHTAGPAGALFDATADRYNEFFFFAGLAYFYADRRGALLLVLAALVGSFMVSYASAKGEALATGAPRGAMRRHERLVYLVIGTALSAVAMHVGWPAGRTDLPLFLALALVAIVANASAVHRLHVMGRRAEAPAPAPSRKAVADVRASFRLR